MKFNICDTRQNLAYCDPAEAAQTYATLRPGLATFIAACQDLSGLRRSSRDMVAAVAAEVGNSHRAVVRSKAGWPEGEVPRQLRRSLAALSVAEFLRTCGGREDPDRTVLDNFAESLSLGTFDDGYHHQFFVPPGVMDLPESEKLVEWLDAYTPVDGVLCVRMERLGPQAEETEWLEGGVILSPALGVLPPGAVPTES